MKYRIDIKSVVTFLVIINFIMFFILWVGGNRPVPQSLLDKLISKGKIESAFAIERRSLIIALFSLFPILIKELGWVWQVFTYMFLHGSFLHIFFNMYALFLFGRPLEEKWGTREFTLFYFFTGIGAGIVTFLWNMVRSPLIPTIGASGAIFGIMLGFGLEFPEAILLLFFIIPVKARYAAFIFGGIELVMILMGSMRGIGHFTHLAGLLFGYIYYVLRIKNLYRGRRVRVRRRVKEVMPKKRVAVSESRKMRDIERVMTVREKIKSGDTLARSDMVFLSKLKDSYYQDSAQLCDYDEFDINAHSCKDCDSFYACLYRFILKK